MQVILRKGTLQVKFTKKFTKDIYEGKHTVLYTHESPAYNDYHSTQPGGFLKILMGKYVTCNIKVSLQKRNITH